MTPRLALLALSLFATPAFADVAYVDDRSSPEAVLHSLYNAINRQELVRAYSYWDGGQVPDYATFAKGYADTRRVDLVLGEVVSNGAAGSVFYNVPVAIRAYDASGAVHEFAGCYVLRHVNPALQEVPPFRGIHIESGAMKPVTDAFEKVLPKGCSG